MGFKKESPRHFVALPPLDKGGFKEVKLWKNILQENMTLR